MKKLTLSIAAAAALLIMTGSVNAQAISSSASSARQDWQSISIDRDAILAKFCERYPSSRACTGVIREVPEIDASSGTQALALVLGLGLLSAEGLRRRRRAIRTR